jgi:hypothetical protein
MLLVDNKYNDCVNLLGKENVVLNYGLNCNTGYWRLVKGGFVM